MPYDRHNIYVLHSLASSDSITALNAVQNLLQSGKVHVNERDYGGLTALHVAAAWDHLAMCQLLLYYGADPFQTDDHGRYTYLIFSRFHLPYEYRHGSIGDAGRN